MKFAKPPSEVPPRPNVLIYGPEKSGKTALATSAGGGTLLFNLDLPNATRYARSRKRDPEGRIQELELAPWMSWEDATRAGVSRTPLLDLMGEVSTAVADPRQDFCEAIAVDPVGELYRRLLEEQSDRTMRPNYDQRMAVITYIERFCRFLCEIPTISAVIVCHELMFDTDEGIEYLPFVGSKNSSQGNLGQKLRGMVDIVAYTGIIRHEDGEKEYMAQLITEKGRRGGDRYDCLGDMRPANLAEWFETIAQYEGSGQVSTRDTSVEGDSDGSPSEVAQAETDSIDAAEAAAEDPPEPSSPASEAETATTGGNGSGTRKGAKAK